MGAVLPLDRSLGLLTDLTQIAEAAGNGWPSFQPLSEEGVSHLLDVVLQQILTEEKPLTFIARLATDFNMLQFVCEQAAATCPDSVDFRREPDHVRTL